MSEDRHHAGDARPAGDAEHVVVFVRVERRPSQRAEDVDLAAEQLAVQSELRKAAVDLAFEHEMEAIHLVREIDHRIGPATDQVGVLERDELPGMEIHRRRQSDLEMDDVAGQLPHDVDMARAVEVARHGFGRLRSADGNADRAIAERPRLAHQDIALVAMKLAIGRCLGPARINAAADHPRSTGSAGSGGALVGESKSGGQTGRKQGIAGPARVGEFVRLRFDRDRRAFEVARGAFDHLQHATPLSARKEIVTVVGIFVVEFIDDLLLDEGEHERRFPPWCRSTGAASRFRRASRAMSGSTTRDVLCRSKRSRR